MKLRTTQLVVAVAGVLCATAPGCASSGDHGSSASKSGKDTAPVGQTRQADGPATAQFDLDLTPDPTGQKYIVYQTADGQSTLWALEADLVTVGQNPDGTSALGFQATPGAPIEVVSSAPGLRFSGGFVPLAGGAIIACAQEMQYQPDPGGGYDVSAANIDCAVRDAGGNWGPWQSTIAPSGAAWFQAITSDAAGNALVTFLQDGNVSGPGNILQVDGATLPGDGFYAATLGVSGNQVIVQSTSFNGGPIDMNNPTCQQPPSCSGDADCCAGTHCTGGTCQ